MFTNATSHYCRADAEAAQLRARITALETSAKAHDKEVDRLQKVLDLAKATEVSRALVMCMCVGGDYTQVQCACGLRWQAWGLLPT